MVHELELFYKLSRADFNLDGLGCFDNDQYVNLKNLYRLLSRMNPMRPYYIGQTSIKHRLIAPENSRTFVFATYDADVCFSCGILQQLRPYVAKTRLPHKCIKHGISDDIYIIGYLNELILNISLTSLKDLFHSHLEKLDASFHQFNINHLQDTITLGFSWNKDELSWLPVIHQLIQLANKDEIQTANTLWGSVQKYENQCQSNISDHFDKSCTSYGVTSHNWKFPLHKIKQNILRLFSTK